MGHINKENYLHCSKMVIVCLSEKLWQDFFLEAAVLLKQVSYDPRVWRNLKVFLAALQTFTTDSHIYGGDAKHQVSDSQGIKLLSEIFVVENTGHKEDKKAFINRRW